MNVISRRKLKDFYEAKPSRKLHAKAFDDWFRLARRAHWRNFQETKATFGQSDVATGETGRTATIFDVGGNKYRIVAHVDYTRQIVLIAAVMDHKEYDRGGWKKLFGREFSMPKTKTRMVAGSHDTYMELVQRFPLKTIKDDDEHARATEVIAGLLGRELDGGAGDYLDALVVLVGKYEDEHHAIDGSMTPQEALRALMEFNGLSQADVGRVIGSESAVSMFLKGDRGLSKGQIKKLADRFKVSADLFL